MGSRYVYVFLIFLEFRLFWLLLRPRAMGSDACATAVRYCVQMHPKTDGGVGGEPQRGGACGGVGSIPGGLLCGNQSGGGAGGGDACCGVEGTPGGLLGGNENGSDAGGDPSECRSQGKRAIDVCARVGGSAEAEAAESSVGCTRSASDAVDSVTLTILDPFCGEGSVLAAANEAGVEAVGIELSRRRCRLAAAYLRPEEPAAEIRNAIKE